MSLILCMNVAFRPAQWRIRKGRMQTSLLSEAEGEAGGEAVDRAARRRFGTLEHQPGGRAALRQMGISHHQHQRARHVIGIAKAIADRIAVGRAAGVAAVGRAHIAFRRDGNDRTDQLDRLAVAIQRQAVRAQRRIGTAAPDIRQVRLDRAARIFGADGRLGDGLGGLDRARTGGTAGFDDQHAGEERSGSIFQRGLGQRRLHLRAFVQAVRQLRLQAVAARRNIVDAVFRPEGRIDHEARRNTVAGSGARQRIAQGGQHAPRIHRRQQHRVEGPEEGVGRPLQASQAHRAQGAAFELDVGLAAEHPVRVAVGGAGRAGVQVHACLEPRIDAQALAQVFAGQEAQPGPRAAGMQCILGLVARPVVHKCQIGNA
ncbi:conserved hypothetical protein, partial [Ricinus communis]